MIFFFKGTATPGIYTYGHTLSLHAALPIGPAGHPRPFRPAHALRSRADGHEGACRVRDRGPADRAALAAALPGHRRRARRDADRVRRTPLLPAHLCPPPGDGRVPQRVVGGLRAAVTGDRTRDV